MASWSNIRGFIHCDATNNPEHDDISIIRGWHTSPDPNDSSKPWQDVGYHFYIPSSGVIQYGRSLEINPAAQAGNNSGTIAICLHGLNEEDFTEAQFEALNLIVKTISSHYGKRITWHGHKEVDKYRACPVFDYKKVLRLTEYGHYTA